MTKYIGFGHISRSGKDTIANALVDALAMRGISAKKISWAWKMKQIAHELYAWAGVEPPEHYETKEGEQDREIKLTKLASPMFPDGPTAVEIWVAIGTPAFRVSVYPKTWVDFVMKQDHGVDVVVVPDVRFHNELDAIYEAGGSCFRCVREGFAGKDSVADKSLRGVEVWTGTVGGHKTSDLALQAAIMATAIKEGRALDVSICRNPDYWTKVYYKNLREAGYAV
jgi:hypothetical protein